MGEQLMSDTVELSSAFSLEVLEKKDFNTGTITCELFNRDREVKNTDKVTINLEPSIFGMHTCIEHDILLNYRSSSHPEQTSYRIFYMKTVRSELTILQ